MPGKGVAVDPAGHYVADITVLPIRCRKILRLIINHPGDGSGSVAVGANVRGKAQTVVRLAEAWVIRATQEQVNRRTVTVGRPQIPQRIKHQPEGIHLSPGVLFDTRAVDLET